MRCKFNTDEIHKCLIDCIKSHPGEGYRTYAEMVIPKIHAMGEKCSERTIQRALQHFSKNGFVIVERKSLFTRYKWNDNQGNKPILVKKFHDRFAQMINNCLGEMA